MGYLEGKWQMEGAKLPRHEKAPSFTFAVIQSAHWAACFDGTSNKITMRKCDSGREQQHFIVPPTGKSGPIRWKYIEGRCVAVDRTNLVWELVLRPCNEGFSQNFK